MVLPSPAHWLALALLADAPRPEWASAHEARLLARTHTDPRGGMPYRLFLPDTAGGRRLPLVIVLHGGAGRGDDNLRHVRGGNGMLVDLFVRPESQARFPAIVLAPQADARGWVDPASLRGAAPLEQALEIVAGLRRDLEVDSTRIYLAGYSLGAYGVLAILAQRPDLCAAGLLVAGGHPRQLDSTPRTPIWIFHGEQDERVSVEQARQLARALRAARRPARYTEYRGEDHGIMRLVVAERQLLPWLFGRSTIRRGGAD
jgi:predicted peptidase